MRRGRWLEVCWYAAVAAGALIVHLAHGEVFYVTPGGSNANAGTSAAPWATLQYAADRVGPGDRVVVRPGSYQGFYLDTSGAPGSPIEFRADPGVLIDEPTMGAGNQDGINLEGASHVVIDGFAVTGMPRAGIRTVGAEDDFAEFVTIRNVHAYDNGRWGIFTGFVDDLLIENNETSGSAIEHGIYVSNSGDRPTIRGNASWGNRANGIHMNGDASLGGDGIISGAVVSGNRIYGNGAGGGSGINMDGVQGSRIENNLIYDNHASGISLYRIDGGGPSSGNVVVNNTVHQAADGRWALNIQDGAVNNTVLNNILVSQHAYRGAIDVSSDSLAGLTSDYNAVIPRFNVGDAGAIYSLGQWRASTGQDAHSFAAAPGELFVDWNAGDYRLRAGSPAINSGASTHAPGVDFAGVARPAGAVDIGAFEESANGGDLTGDGIVDGEDLAVWQSALGEGSAGDADGDGDSDGGDFLILQRSVGVAAIGVAVAEPTLGALGMAAAAAVLILARGS
ncbi:MAG: right-handed parallel beta-helix repeat-containing protein [Pirellulales bacterium]|nr:right-handed parallel beta-helix repeat-containing protein [Pirellulales bacterium]